MGVQLLLSPRFCSIIVPTCDIFLLFFFFLSFFFFHDAYQSLGSKIHALMLCLIFDFALMLYVPVNSNGHVETLSPFYVTFTQH